MEASCVCQGGSNAPRGSSTYYAVSQSNNVPSVLQLNVEPHRSTNACQESQSLEQGQPGKLFFQCYCPSGGNAGDEGVSKKLGIQVQPAGYRSSMKQPAEPCGTEPSSSAVAPPSLALFTDAEQASPQGMTDMQPSSPFVSSPPMPEELCVGAEISTRRSSSATLETPTFTSPTETQTMPPAPMQTRALWKRCRADNYGILIIKEEDGSELVVKVPIQSRANAEQTMWGIAFNVFAIVGSTVLAILLGQLVQSKSA